MEAALGRVEDALDAANHSRPRITVGHIEEAVAVLQEQRRYEATDR